MYEKTNLINNCLRFDDAKVRSMTKTRKSIQRNRRIFQRNGSGGCYPSEWRKDLDS